MSGYIYILECTDGSFYVGSTRDVARRVDQHNSGDRGRYTRTRRPVRLVYQHECETVAEAYAREKRVQGWSRAKRRALVAGDFDLLTELSRSRR
ncbi:MULTISPECIES: GIY-YIG nuclease family protein [unclassified Gordonia (in: high G+C Gram-positive bacteria)]